MHLTPAMQNFILHWGEMGAKWGVNRSVAQIHALLHISRDPLTADEICDTLRARRDRYGVSYVTVAERYADEFAPVVAALAGS